MPPPIKSSNLPHTRCRLQDNLNNLSRENMGFDGATWAAIELDCLYSIEIGRHMARQMMPAQDDSIAPMFVRPHDHIVCWSNTVLQSSTMDCGGGKVCVLIEVSCLSRSCPMEANSLLYGPHRCSCAVHVHYLPSQLFCPFFVFVVACHT